MRAVEYNAELCPSIVCLSCLNRSSAGSALARLPETVCITEESWSGPMTHIFAFGHIHKNRGEYCLLAESRVASADTYCAAAHTCASVS